jgi:surface polysaccharide O-acyltransferase-like enzyme
MLLAAGCALHFLEVAYLWRWYHVYPLEEYVFGTYLMGVGAAVMALSDHPGIRWSALARFGPATLGVYLVNPIFSELLEPVGQRRDVIWQVSHLAAVLALSLLTVLLLSRSRYLRWLVLPERRSMDLGGPVPFPGSGGGPAKAQ